MTKPTAKLSNCYVPLPLSVLEKQKENQKAPQQEKQRTSGDDKSTTRADHELRRLLIESDVLPSARGSARVDLGHTKVICQVLGPVSGSSALVPPSVQLSMDEGTLYCEVKYAPHVGYPATALVASSVSSLEPSQQLFSSSKVNSWIMTRETDLSSRLLSSLSAAVPLKPYPKCALIVRVTILQDDGSALAACISAASLALTNAAVEVYDFVTCCSVAVKNGKLLADPDLSEELAADALVTVAMLPNWKEVSLWEQTGRLSPAMGNEAINLCRDGCRTMHRFLREHILQQQAE